MTYRAVDCHNMMGGRGFRVEQLKIQTFVFRFLALVCTRPAISPTLTAPSSLIHSTIHKAARTPSPPSLDLDPSWSWY